LGGRMLRDVDVHDPSPFVRGRCSKGVDLVLDYHSKLVAIDEEADHQIVHGRRFGKANGAAHEPFNPRPQIDVFTPTTTLQCVEQIYTRRIAVLRSPATRATSFFRAHNPWCYNACS
jgi:hypothetical protein